jgi:hypothetical protein
MSFDARVSNTPGSAELSTLFCQIMIRSVTGVEDDAPRPGHRRARRAWGFESTGPIIFDNELQTFNRLIIQHDDTHRGDSGTRMPCHIRIYHHIVWLAWAVTDALRAARLRFRASVWNVEIPRRDGPTSRRCHCNGTEDPAQLVERLFLAMLDMAIHESLTPAVRRLVDRDLGIIHDAVQPTYCKNMFDGIFPHESVQVFTQTWGPRAHVNAAMDAPARDLDGDEDDSSPADDVEDDHTTGPEPF